MCRLKEARAQLVLLDEIDKIQDGNRNYPTEPVLFEVLEPGQSDRFTDEYLEVPLNITPIVSWIATANDSSKISAPLRSRMETFEVPLPTADQMPAVIRSVDRALRSRQPELEKVFAPLADAVIEKIRDVSPRDLRVVLEQAYGSALERPKQFGQHHVIFQDVQYAMAKRVPVASEMQSVEPDQQWVMMVPVKRSGGGGAPPGNTLH